MLAHFSRMAQLVSDRWRAEVATVDWAARPLLYSELVVARGNFVHRYSTFLGCRQGVNTCKCKIDFDTAENEPFKVR